MPGAFEDMLTRKDGYSSVTKDGVKQVFPLAVSDLNYYGIDLQAINQFDDGGGKRKNFWTRTPGRYNPTATAEGIYYRIEANGKYEPLEDNISGRGGGVRIATRVQVPQD